MLFQTLCRRWTNRHHPLEDANKTQGRPQSTPPQHSQRSNLRDLNYFSWNEHTPTSQQIYRLFYPHHCIFFNWSWGWPWNRCRVVRWARGFEMFLCDEKKNQTLLHLNSRWQRSIHRVSCNNQNSFIVIIVGGNSLPHKKKSTHTIHSVLENVTAACSWTYSRRGSG